MLLVGTVHIGLELDRATVVTKHTDTYQVLYAILFMSSLGGFVPNFSCHLSRRISKPRCCHLERSIVIDHLKKHKTLSSLAVMSVFCSRVCTMSSTVCCNWGVQSGSLMRRISLQIPEKETISLSHRSLVC